MEDSVSNWISSLSCECHRFWVEWFSSKKCLFNLRYSSWLFSQLQVFSTVDPLMSYRWSQIRVFTMISVSKTVRCKFRWTGLMTIQWILLVTRSYWKPFHHCLHGMCKIFSQCGCFWEVLAHGMFNCTFSLVIFLFVFFYWVLHHPHFSVYCHPNDLDFFPFSWGISYICFTNFRPNHWLICLR